ncbi:hypothetical protein CERSUDRAFT_69913 [Gelatoporia subvermispora B]|uniref:RNA helicase n=1 Tax=Ceriporiopsis subvermispora (strain B) TaxID=914234 RepID=M2RA82_CERS8|nr:hypothetical protein CERSUDRAFT_69913 [Gelatoporia subvermispora B]
MSLLALSRIATRSAAQLPPELVLSCLHTSAPCLGGGPRPKKLRAEGYKKQREAAKARRTTAQQGPSSTRLVRDLGLPHNTGGLDAQKGYKRPKFKPKVVVALPEREPAPHPDAVDKRNAREYMVERHLKRSEQKRIEDQRVVQKLMEERKNRTLGAQGRGRSQEAQNFQDRGSRSGSRTRDSPGLRLRDANRSSNARHDAPSFSSGNSFRSRDVTRSSNARHDAPSSSPGESFRSSGNSFRSSENSFRSSENSFRSSENSFRAHDASHSASVRHDAPSPPSRSSFRPSQVENPLSEELDISPKSVSTRSLPSEFTSPPLMADLLTSVQDILGPHAKPSPIQALSLKHIIQNLPQTSDSNEEKSYVQFLLASETGSGKSIAYMLPVLQDLKAAELGGENAPRRNPTNPRALILAPTHELSRQLTSFAKALIHRIKLRVVGASRANAKWGVTASRMARAFGEAEGTEGDNEVEVTRTSGDVRPMDVLVGTPSKILEMVKGRGWDRSSDATGSAVQRRRDGAAFQPLFKAGRPEIGLQEIEWVVIDEADVLLDPDFQAYTRLLLAEISAARGRPVPFEPQLDLTAQAEAQTQTQVDYPFNLLLTTATIPSSLAAYLDAFHPSMTRLASPNLHHLPAGIKTEYATWTGGNRNADVEQRLRALWYTDVAQRDGKRSKVLIFCNKSSKVLDLGEFLTEKGIPNVALVSKGDTRKRGSNTHLAGFLRVQAGDNAKPEDGEDTEAQSAVDDEMPEVDEDLIVDTIPADASGETGVQKEPPHVLITTSLLSRGLDFSPDIKHVFIMDQPRNMVDFLHRAGRTGRAGGEGTVVVFGKTTGRGSERTREVRQKVRALAA